MLCIEIAERGYRKREPNEAPREASQVMAKIFAALREDGVSRADIAAALAVHVEEIDQLVFGLVLTALSSASSRVASGRSRPELRVVSGRAREDE